MSTKILLITVKQARLGFSIKTSLKILNRVVLIEIIVFRSGMRLGNYIMAVRLPQYHGQLAVGVLIIGALIITLPTALRQK